MRYHQRQCIHLLLQVILLTASCLAENLTLSINFKRRMFVTNGAFLSLTVDPAALLNTTDVLVENFERYTNMVQGLAPAYVRFGGPRSNSYIYDRVDVDPDDVLFETHSTLIHRWAENAGLYVIACISPRYIADKSETYSWEPTNLAQLLSFNDRMGHNASWQLGYECQTRCDLSGGDLGRYVANLHETLKTYPRYSDSLITGPDIVAYRTAQQRQYLRDYLSTAGDSLSAVTWHPDFAGITVHGNDISVHSDNIVAEKDELYEVIGDIVVDKPLWIAESKPEECKHRYIGALTWTRRLGNAAKLGAQVVMRQFLEFSRPTPDYWVSFLHKALVGREVLEVKVQPEDENVHFYSQCTRPSALYEKGAVTIFGVNLTPREVTASLKDFKIKTLHEYILSPDSAAGNKMFAERVLLNDEPFDLIDDMKLPDLNPEIVTDSNGLQLKLASGNIGFWIIPNAKIKACMYEEEGTTEDIAAKKLLKRHVLRRVDEKEQQEEENINPSNTENRKLHAKEERTKRRSNRTHIRRKFLKTKLYDRIKRLLQKSMQQKEENETSNIQKPSTIIIASEQNTPEKTEKQEYVDKKHFKGTEKPNNNTKTNDYILVNRKSRAETERPFKREVRDIDNAMRLIPKIEALLQLEEEVTSNNIKDETRNAEDTVIETSGKFNEEFGELTKKSKVKTIEEIEKYFNVLNDLLEDNKLITKNVENNQIYKNPTNKKRYIRDLSKRLEDPKKDIHMRRSRTDDLKDRTRRKMRRRNDDRKETSVVASDLMNLDNGKSIFHDLFRQCRLKRFLRGNNHRVDPQHSAFNTEEYGRATRDVNTISTEIGARKDATFRKRSRIDDVRDYVYERKSKRKDDFKREGLLSPLNLRITDGGESGFFRRDPIRGFPKGDVFVTTGVSAEHSGLDYNYVEDDSKRKDQQEKQESTVESEDVFLMKADEDDNQRDYRPNEFYENINLPSVRILESAKDYDDLCEAEFILGKRENNKDNDGSATINHSQPFDKEEAKRVEEKSAQLVDYDDNLGKKKYNEDANHEILESNSELSTPLHQLTEIPATKYEFINYQTSEASPEAVKRKLKADSKFSSFFYQPALVSPVKDDCSNFQALSVRPNVEYMENSINNIVYNKRNKRSNWKKQQELFAEEMIKEDASNVRDCNCRVIRARNSPKKRYNNRMKRDQMSAIEFMTSEAADANANANLDLTRLARNVQSPITKEEFDRIMTGEILPSTSVIETDSDYDKRDAAISDISNKSYRRANEAIQTVDVVSTPVMSPSGTSDISAQQVMEESTFFRAQPSTTSSEIEEATYDSTEAALQVSPHNKESRQELLASAENARQAPCLFEETQDLKEETQRESTDTATEVGKAKGRCDDCEVSSKSDEETTKRIDQEYVTTEISKRATRKTRDYSRLNKSKTSKESKESQQSENKPSSSNKCANRARLKEENKPKTIISIVQDLQNSQLRDLARYEEYLVKRNGQIQKLKEKLKEKREKRRNNSTKIVDEQARNLKRREAWGKFCENNDFCRLIDQEKLLKFLISEIETHISDEDDDDDEDYDDDEEDEKNRYLPVEFVPKRYDSLRDQTYPHVNMKYYPEYNSRYHFLRRPKTIEIEQEPVTLSSSSSHKIFAIDPSTYRGGEPVLELHEELDAAPKYSSKIKFQTEAPRWTLKDFYRTLSRPAKIYEDQQTFKPYDNYADNYCDQEYARKSHIKEAHERGNAVVLDLLYLLDKHQQYDLSQKLAELSRIYFSVLDRQDIDQVAKDKTKSDSNNGDTKSTSTTAKKIGLPKKIDEKYTGTNKFTHEKLGNHYEYSHENVGKVIDRSHEINDEVDDNTDTSTSNMEARNVEEGIIDDSNFETSRLLDISNITPRKQRNTEEQMTDKSQERIRQSRADMKTESDYDKYICMKEEDSEAVSSEQSIPLYQLTRLSPLEAVLLRKDYATSLSRNVNRQEGKESSKYAVFTPDKIKDVRSYEMLGAKNPERYSKRVGFSSWLERYLPRRITNAMIRYLDDVSSEELEYEDTLSGSAEEISNEEVSYSSDYSDESNKSRRKVARNVADEVDCESREEDQQHEVKSKESHGHLKMKGRIRSEERRAFMPLPEENEKTKRQRRQAEIDKQEANKSVLTENAAKDENNKYYLQRNSINEKGRTTDYPHPQKDGKIHDNFLEDFVKSRKNVITSTGNEGNNESLENSIAKGNRKSPSFMGETIPKLEGVIMDGLEKAKDLTESVEQFVDNFEANFNETSATDEETSSTNKTSWSTDNPFHFAIMNIKKFFTLFSGISRILRV